MNRQKPAPLERRPWLAVALFCVVLATFLPCLRNGFVNLDDTEYVWHNPHVVEGLTWKSIKWAWSTTDCGNWHPVTWMVHLLDGELFRSNPMGHHAASVFLHAANATLLFLLLQKLTGARWLSLVVAALFGLHPLRVESVAWASEMKDVLSTFFWLLATWAYARYAGNFKFQISNFKWYGVSLLLFALGLMSKSMLVTMPFALLLLDFWPLQRWGRVSAKQLLLEKVPFLVLAAADSAVTYLVQQQSGSVTPIDALGIPARLANAVVSYARYLQMTAWPVNLCAIYPYQGEWPRLMVAGSALVLAVITALVLWQGRGRPFLAVGWFWFLGTLVPVIGFVQVGRQALADRYTYIPSIGLFIALVWGTHEWAEHRRNRIMLARVLVGLSMAACIALTVRQIGFWKDSETLFARGVEVNQHDWVNTGYLAKELEKKGKIDEAVAMYQQSLRINPYRPEVRFQLANLFLQNRHLNEALAQFQQGVTLNPSDIDLRRGFASALQDVGRLDEAIEQFNQVIHIKRDDADAYSNLGNCYGMKGRTGDAIGCFEQAVKLKPNLAENHRDLGVGLANAARWDEAINQFRQALELDPADGKAQRFLELAVQNKAKAAH